MKPYNNLLTVYLFRLLKVIILSTLLFFPVKAEPPEFQSTEISVGPNFRIYPSDVSQTEVFITVHPQNPDILFASANTVIFNPFFVSEGVYVSTDGGTSWFGSDTCSGQPITLHGGDPGIAIDKNGTFILTRLGTGPFTGLYSHYSTDNGLTWSSQNTITTDILERAALSTDGSPGSPFYGRTYATWVRLLSPYPAFVVYTDDGGQHWSSPIQVNSPIQQSAGGDVAVARDGTVHVCWAGVMSASPFTEIFVGHASSTDGGNTWSATENAFSVNGIKGFLANKDNIRVDGLPRIAIDNSGGPRDGWIYIVTAEKNLPPAGSDPDIILHRSTDGGITWSEGIRVNQDPLNNGKQQYMPAITVDDFGGVNIIYYDDRHTSSDSATVFLSRSTDGGNSWQDLEISDHHFKPIPIGGLGQGYQGDNIGLVAVGNTLWPVWMDNSTGIYQVWTAPINLTALGISPSEEKVARGFSLLQNYPNPFNSSTIFQVVLKQSSHVRLEVFSLTGKKLDTIVAGSLSAGEHHYRWNPTTLASGIYFYRLTVDGMPFPTRKLLLLK